MNANDDTLDRDRMTDVVQWPAQRPMSELPPIARRKDGLRVLVQIKDPGARSVGAITIARWKTHAYNTPNRGHWQIERSAGYYAQDDKFVGWWPLPEPQP